MGIIFVEKKEALSKYIKENIVKLTSKSSSKDSEKKLRKEFSEHHNLKSDSRFSGREVADEISKYILKTQSQNKTDFISLLKEIPFVNSELNEHQLSVLFDTYSHDTSLIISSTDLPKLTNEDYLRRIQDKFLEMAKNRVDEENSQVLKEIEELRNELEKKKEEIDKFTSELNKLPDDLSIQEIEEKTEKGQNIENEDVGIPWWKKIGLIQNPFDTNTGLYGIKTDKYEDVTVKTPLFKKYKSEFENASNSLVGKTIIIIGDFGSGKTTFFQYLSNRGIINAIRPINIIINPLPNVSNLTNFFLEELYNNLSDIVLELYNYDPRAERNNDNNYNKCLVLFKELDKNTSQGFVVFVDGLHKGETYLNQTMEFLQQIQNISEFFASKGIKLGFFIAGSLLWETHLSNRPSLSGSYYRMESIPPLTEEFAIDAVNRRIKLYSSDMPNLITIEEQGLRKAFHILEKRLDKGITFRDFLDHIRDRLELNQFDEVGLSVKIHIETTDAVRASLLKSPIGDKFGSIIQEISYSSRLRSVFESTILKIYHKKGISESDEIFKKNSGVFYLLRKFDLIVQRKRQDESYFKWYLSDEFLTVILTTSQNLSLTPTRTLAAAFEEKSVIKISEPNAIYGSSLEKLKNLITTWHDSIPEVTNLLEGCEALINSITQKLSLTNSFIFEDVKKSILRPIEAINLVLFDKPLNGDPFLIFKESWIVPENVDDFQNLFFQVESGLQDKSIYGILHKNNKLISQLLDMLTELVRGESISRLAGKEILSSEFISIHSLRSKFLSQRYSEVIDGCCSLLERKIRDTVYPFLRVLWGNESIDQLPKDIRTGIEKLSNKGHPRTKRSNDSNFLYDISRSEYSKVLFNNRIWKALFESLIKDSDKVKFKEILELSFSLDDRNAHRDRESYFRARSTVISDVLKNLPWLLEIFNRLNVKFILNCDIKLENIDGVLNSQFLPKMQTVLNQRVWKINGETVKEMKQVLIDKAINSILKIENPSNFFNSPLCEQEEFISIFRAALKSKQLNVIDDGKIPIRVEFERKTG